MGDPTNSTTNTNPTGTGGLSTGNTNNNDIEAILKKALGGGNTGGLFQDAAGLWDFWQTISGKNNKDTQSNINRYAFPNAPYVQDYAKMLNTAMTDPGSYDLTPGAKFARDQGLQGVARYGNAMFSGSRSGGTAIELEKYATGFAAQNRNTYIDQLIRMTQGSPDAAKLFDKGKNNGLLNAAGGMSAIDDLIRMATGKSAFEWLKSIGVDPKSVGISDDPYPPGGGGPGSPDDPIAPPIDDTGGGGGPGSPGWGSDITGPDISGPGDFDFDMGL